MSFGAFAERRRVLKNHNKGCNNFANNYLVVEIVIIVIFQEVILFLSMSEFI